eukprot:7341280-Prymnesium_polylepis.1
MPHFHRITRPPPFVMRDMFPRDTPEAFVTLNVRMAPESARLTLSARMGLEPARLTLPGLLFASRAARCSIHSCVRWRRCSVEPTARTTLSPPNINIDGMTGSISSRA